MSYRFADSLLAGSGWNCPEHVEFHSKNKFEKSVHIVGFIIRNVSRFTATWTSNAEANVYIRLEPLEFYGRGMSRCNRSSRIIKTARSFTFKLTTRRFLQNKLTRRRKRKGTLLLRNTAWRRLTKHFGVSTRITKQTACYCCHHTLFIAINLGASTSSNIPTYSRAQPVLPLPASSSELWEVQASVGHNC